MTAEAVEPLIFALKSEVPELRLAATGALDKIDPNWKKNN